MAAWLNYTVKDVGTQTVNLNNGYTNNIGHLNCTVYIDGENRTQGDGWTLSNDGWVTVTGATSNVSIYYPPIPAPNNLPPPIAVAPSNPLTINAVFLFVAVVTTLVLIVSVATVLMFRREKSQKA
ncbi:MAG: hypothetical protein ABSD42_01765 [Candidatus Bathyarchaeia archaeon]